MMAERLEYANKTNREIADEFCKVFEHNSNDLVVEKGIEVFSFCEHHIALMYNMRVSVGYLPNGTSVFSLQQKT